MSGYGKGVCYDFQNKGTCFKGNRCQYDHIAPTSETLRRKSRNSNEFGDWSSLKAAQDRTNRQDPRQFSRSVACDGNQEQQRNEERRTNNQPEFKFPGPNFGKHTEHTRRDSSRPTESTSRPTDGINHGISSLSRKPIKQEKYVEIRTIVDVSVPPPKISDNPTLDAALDELKTTESSIRRLGSDTKLQEIPAWIDKMQILTDRRQTLMNTIKLFKDVKIEGKSKRARSRSRESYSASRPSRSRRKSSCERYPDSQSRSRSRHRSKEYSRAPSRSRRDSSGGRQNKSQRKRKNRSRSQRRKRSKERSRSRSRSSENSSKGQRRQSSGKYRQDDESRSHSSRQGNSDRREESRSRSHSRQGESQRRSKSRQQSGDSLGHGKGRTFQDSHQSGHPPINIKQERDFFGPRKIIKQEREFLGPKKKSKLVWNEPANGAPWECEECGRNTVSQRAECFHCKTLKQGNWRCTANNCKTPNWFKSMACEKHGCSEPNPKVWVCQLDGCGEHNWPNKDICHGCGKDGRVKEGPFNNKFYDTKKRNHFNRERDVNSADKRLEGSNYTKIDDNRLERSNYLNIGDKKLDRNNDSVASRNNTTTENNNNGKAIKNSSPAKDPESWKSYFEEQKERNKKENEIENSKSLKIQNRLAMLAGNYLTGGGEAVTDQGDAIEEDDDEVLCLDPSEEVGAAGFGGFGADSGSNEWESSKTTKRGSNEWGSSKTTKRGSNEWGSSQTTKRSHLDDVRNQIEAMFDPAAAGPSRLDNAAGPSRLDNAAQNTQNICIDLSDSEDESHPVEQENTEVTVQEDKRMLEMRKSVEALRSATGKNREKILRENGIVSTSPECIDVIDLDDEDDPEPSSFTSNEGSSNDISKGEESINSSYHTASSISKGEKSKSSSLSHTGSSNSMTRGEKPKNSAKRLEQICQENRIVLTSQGSPECFNIDSEDEDVPEPSSCTSDAGSSNPISKGEKPKSRPSHTGSSISISKGEKQKQRNSSRSHTGSSNSLQEGEKPKSTSKSHVASANSMEKGEKPKSSSTSHAGSASKNGYAKLKDLNKTLPCPPNGHTISSKEISKEEKQKQSSGGTSQPGSSKAMSEGEQSEQRVGLATPEQPKKLKLSEYLTRQMDKERSSLKSNKRSHGNNDKGQINASMLRKRKAEMYMKDSVEVDLPVPSLEENEGLVEVPDEVYSTPPPSVVNRGHPQHKDAIDEDDDIEIIRSKDNGRNKKKRAK